MSGKKDASKTYNDSNSCNNSKTTYTVTYPTGVTIPNMTREEVLEYVENILNHGYSGTFSVQSIER